MASSTSAAASFLQLFSQQTAGDSQLEKAESPITFTVRLAFRTGTEGDSNAPDALEAATQPTTQGEILSFGELLHPPTDNGDADEAAAKGEQMGSEDRALINVKLAVAVQRTHISYLAISWVCKWLINRRTCADRRTLFLTAANLADSWYTCNKVSELQPDELDAVSQQLALGKDELAALNKEGDLYHLTISYSAREVLACNLLTENKCGEHTEVMTKVRKHIEARKPTVFDLLAKSEDIEIILKQFAELIKTDKPILGKTGAVLYPNLAQWWRNGIVNPQMGMQIKPDDRPKIQLPAKFNFFSREEWVTIIYHALIQELELVHRRRLPMEAYVRFCTLAGAGGRKYWAFIEQGHMIEEGIRQRFEVGNTFRLCLLTDTNRRILDWPGVVTEGVAFAPWTDACAIVSRCWIRDEEHPEGGYFEALELPKECVLDVDAQTDTETVRQRLTDMKPLAVGIHLEESDRAITRQINAVNKLWLSRDTPAAEATFALLLANEPSRLPSRPAFVHLLEGDVTKAEIDTAIAKHAVGLNEEEREALECVGTDIPGGLQLIYGGAGAGKSYVARAIAKVAFECRRQDTRARLLIVSSSNAHVDEVAANIDKDIKDVVPPSWNPCVVRCHSVETEKAISKRDASSKRENTTIARGRPVMEEVLPSEVNTVAGAVELYDAYLASVKRTFTGIDDKRVQNLGLSIGARILEVAGVSKTPEGKISPLAPGDWEKRFSTLREHLKQWGDGEHFDAQKMEAFTKDINDAREYVLEFVVDVLVTTASNAMADFLSSAFHAEWIMIEEASRVSEAELAALHFFYSPQYMLMVGDLFQLPPTTRVPRREASFGDQQSRSPFARFLLAGFRRFELTIEHRYGEAICGLMNKVAYKHQQVHASVQHRESTVRANVIFNKLFPGKCQGVAWVNVVEGKAEQNVNASRFNLANVPSVLFWVAQLLGHGVQPADILLVVPYNGQIALYRLALVQFTKWLEEQPTQVFKEAAAKMSQCHLVSFDSVQGTESSWVIVDTVVTDFFGFLQETSRIVVALSRARDGLIIVGNAQGLEAANKNTARMYHRSPLGKAIDWCKQQGMEFPRPAQVKRAKKQWLLTGLKSYLHEWRLNSRGDQAAIKLHGRLEEEAAAELILFDDEGGPEAAENGASGGEGSGLSGGSVWGGEVSGEVEDGGINLEGQYEASEWDDNNNDLAEENINWEG